MPIKSQPPIPPTQEFLAAQPRLSWWKRLLSHVDYGLIGRNDIAVEQEGRSGAGTGVRG